MSLQVDKKSLQKVIGKALCQTGKTKFLKSIALQFDKAGVIFMKIETGSRAAFGKFSSSEFKTYKITGKILFPVNEAHISSLKYHRDENISVKIIDNVVNFQSTGNSSDIKFTSDEGIDEEFRKFLKIKESEGNKFAYLNISDKPEQYSEDDERHAPIYAYIIIKAEDLTNIPSCDSVVIEGTEDSLKIKSVDYAKGTATHVHDLEAKFYEPLVDSFSIRFDKTFLDMILKHFPEFVNITITKRYLMYMDQFRGGFYGYMQGITGQKQEIISEDFSSEISELDELQTIEDELEETLDNLEETE